MVIERPTECGLVAGSLRQARHPRARPRRADLRGRRSPKAQADLAETEPRLPKLAHLGKREPSGQWVAAEPAASPVTTLMCVIRGDFDCRCLEFWEYRLQHGMSF